MSAEQVQAKTYKREVAYVLVALWVFITIWIAVALPPAMVSHYDNFYSTFTWVSWLFITAAFGMKVYQNVAAGRLGAP